MTWKRHRLQRFAKWAGVLACVLVLVAWPLSMRRYVIVCVYRTQVSLKAGVFAYVRWGKGFVGEDEPFRYAVMQRRSNSSRWRLQFWTSGGNANGEIPLYLFLLAAGIPTIILWRGDRRHPPGHCQNCGYNLTRNVSGVCPECGSEVSA